MQYDWQGMVNILEEAETALKENGKTSDEVVCVGIPNRIKASWKDFADFAVSVNRCNNETEVISLELIISGEGWWLERHYDGYFGGSWWEFKSQPDLSQAKPTTDISELGEHILNDSFCGTICGEYFEFGENWRKDLADHIAGEDTTISWWTRPEKYGLIKDWFYDQDTSGLYNREHLGESKGD